MSPDQEQIYCLMIHRNIFMSRLLNIHSPFPHHYHTPSLPSFYHLSHPKVKFHPIQCSPSGFQVNFPFTTPYPYSHSPIYIPHNKLNTTSLLYQKTANTQFLPKQVLISRSHLKFHFLSSPQVAAEKTVKTINVTIISKIIDL